MIELLFIVIILGIIAWAINAISIPQPFKTVAFAILLIILVIYLFKLIRTVNI